MEAVRMTTVIDEYDDRATYFRQVRKIPSRLQREPS